MGRAISVLRNQVWHEAILDFGCSGTVTGGASMDKLIEKSNCDLKRYQTNSKSFAGFTEEQVESRESIILHVICLRSYAKLSVHVIKAETPRPFSRR